MAAGWDEIAGRPVGYFGASTGAAAALVAAAQRPDTIRAVVSRGGRPDLAGEAFGILARGETDHTKSIGVGVDHGEGTLTDGARGPENGDAFHIQLSAIGFRLSASVNRQQFTVNS